ncbi:MAG: EamA family transporter [Candidatus Latescibacterota bacterium]|nr:EamA family transporter [Candidatus Latescibacterota bacterium]
MSLSVFGLVLLAAFCHAGWNLATRRLRGDLTVLWLGGIVATVFITPFAALRYSLGVDPWATTPAALVCILLTGVIHALYFLLLGRAYERGEISVIYPIARGSGIGLTALIAHVLLGESISTTGVFGIGAVCVGILLLAVPAWVVHRTHGVGLALAVGATIPLYSIVDKVGTHLVPAVIYIWVMYLLTSVLLAPLVLRKGRARVSRIWRQSWKLICGIGIGAMLTYLIILFAYQMGPVGYIVAARESSIVVGAAAGVVWLGERFDRWKLAGVGSVTIGLVLLRLA